MRTVSKTRRQLLRSAAATGIGLTAISGAGVASAESKCPFDCDYGTYVKFEFVIERDDDGNVIDCYFEEETDTGLLEITSWESKEGEECEPISVEWESTSTPAYVATKGAAFGGDDCKDIEDPSSGSYESDLKNKGGRTAAISNLQFCVERAEPLECPDGTRPVARYDADGNTFTFTDGEDVVTFSNKPTDGDGNLTGFDFESGDGSDDNSEPETLTTVTVEYDSTVETFEVDPNFDVNKQSGSVSVDGDIDRILFCQAVYAQADFVTGDVIEDLCEDQYSDDKLTSVTWSSFNGQLDGKQGQKGEFDFGEDALTVTYDSEEYDQKVSLAVYEVDDPEFQDNNNISFKETRCRQTPVDSETDEVADQDGILMAEWPTLY